MSNAFAMTAAACTGDATGATASESIRQTVPQRRGTVPPHLSALTMVLRGQDAWRQHPVFQNLWRSAFPGFKYGVIAFGTYVVLEGVYSFATKPRAHPGAKPAGA